MSVGPVSVFCELGFILPKWIKFNPSMDESSYPLFAWMLLFIPVPIPIVF